jgi:hypothetical protein
MERPRLTIATQIPKIRPTVNPATSYKDIKPAWFRPPPKISAEANMKRTAMARRLKKIAMLIIE